MSHIEGMEPAGGLTHVDTGGHLHMVDVGDRPVADREATAEGRVKMSPQARDAILGDSVAKGNVLEVCRLAGIMAAKRTPDLIPLCHPIALTHVQVDAELDQAEPAVRLRATARCRDATGVEMEALTAVTVAALTVIDMIKSIDPWAVIDGVGLRSKSGGRSGAVQRPGRSSTGRP
jgi:cyclic pyranopterin phosphate synthase